MDLELKHVRGLFFFISDLSSKLNKPIMNSDNGSGIDTKKVKVLEDNIVNYLTADTPQSRIYSTECLKESLGTSPYLFLLLTQNIAKTARVYITLPGITDYHTYVCQIPCKYLNNNALLHLKAVNSEPF